MEAKGGKGNCGEGEDGQIIIDSSNFKNRGSIKPEVGY